MQPVDTQSRTRGTAASSSGRQPPPLPPLPGGGNRGDPHVSNDTFGNDNPEDPEAMIQVTLTTIIGMGAESCGPNEEDMWNLKLYASLSAAQHCHREGEDSPSDEKLGFKQKFVYGHAQELPPIVELLEGHMRNGLAAAIPDFLSNKLTAYAMRKPYGRYSSIFLEE
eukprot:177001-Amphidinium_carterae.1